MQRMQCLTEDCLVREDHVNKNTLVSNLNFDCLNETQCYHVLEYCNQSGYNIFIGIKSNFDFANSNSLLTNRQAYVDNVGIIYRKV